MICLRFHKIFLVLHTQKKLHNMFLEEDKHVLVWLLKGDNQQNDIMINLVSLMTCPKSSEISFQNFLYSRLIFNEKLLYMTMNLLEFIEGSF